MRFLAIGGNIFKPRTKSHRKNRESARFLAKSSRRVAAKSRNKATKNYHNNSAEWRRQMANWGDSPTVADWAAESRSWIIFIANINTIGYKYRIMEL